MRKVKIIDIYGYKSSFNGVNHVIHGKIPNRDQVGVLIEESDDYYLIQYVVEEQIMRLPFKKVSLEFLKGQKVKLY